MNMDKEPSKCWQCKEIEIPEHEYCCSGWMCGCEGKPIDPPFCEKCWNEILYRSEMGQAEGHRPTE